MPKNAPKDYFELRREYAGATPNRKNEIKQQVKRHYKTKGIRGKEFRTQWNRHFEGKLGEESPEISATFRRTLAQMTHNQKRITLEDLKLKNMKGSGVGATIGFEMRLSKELRELNTDGRTSALNTILSVLRQYKRYVGKENLTSNMVKNITEITKFIKNYTQKRQEAGQKIRPVKRRKTTIPSIFNKKDIKGLEDRQEIYQYWAGVAEDYEPFKEALEEFMGLMNQLIINEEDKETLEIFDRLKNIVDSQRGDDEDKKIGGGFQYVFPIPPMPLILKPNDMIAFRLIKEFGRARGYTEILEDEDAQRAKPTKEEVEPTLDEERPKGETTEERRAERQISEAQDDVSVAEEQEAFGVLSGSTSAEIDLSGSFTEAQINEIEEDELISQIEELFSEEVMVDPLLNLAVLENETFEALSESDIKEIQDAMRNNYTFDFDDSQMKEYEDFIESLESNIEELDDTEGFMLPLTEDFTTK